MRTAADPCRASATSGAPVPAPPVSPVLSIDHDVARSRDQVPVHTHDEPMLAWSSTATLISTVAGRDWMIPPGYGLWIPGGVEHAGTVLHGGEVSTVVFAAETCPIPWREPTSILVGSLLAELVTHLRHIAPDDASRAAAEALLFRLLVPLPPHHVRLAMPVDARVRAVAEGLIAHPADQRELAAWAEEVHSSVRTLSRLFRAETGLNFAAWRTQVRIRAAVPMLTRGVPVDATARAVGYRRPSAFVTAFRRVTAQTPGTYLPRRDIRSRPR